MDMHMSEFQKKDLLDYSQPVLVDCYTDEVSTIGLWQSEKNIITRYSQVSDRILDIGCGAGRIAIGLSYLGYENVMGVDIIPEMINRASALSQTLTYKPLYFCSNIIDFKAPCTYHLAIFGYNGIMGIKSSTQRLAVMRNIYNLLVDKGIFIFTTHEDRLLDEKWVAFWRKREEEWKSGNHYEGSDEIGDLIVEDRGCSVYQYFSTNKEIETLISHSGFQLMQTMLRSEICLEPSAVTSASNDCRFWICLRV